MRLRNVKLFFLIAPILLMGLGTACNQLVMLVNHGQMPVFVPNCDIFNFDIRHTCMTPETHLKFLADWTKMPGFTESIGDVFIDLGDWLSYPFLLFCILTIWVDRDERSVLRIS